MEAGVKWTGKETYWLEAREEVRKAELEGRQWKEMESKLQFHSHLMFHIFESSQLEGSYVWNLM